MSKRALGPFQHAAAYVIPQIEFEELQERLDEAQEVAGAGAGAALAAAEAKAAALRSQLAEKCKSADAALTAAQGEAAALRSQLEEAQQRCEALAAQLAEQMAAAADATSAIAARDEAQQRCDALAAQVASLQVAAGVAQAESQQAEELQQQLVDSNARCEALAAQVAALEAAAVDAVAQIAALQAAAADSNSGATAALTASERAAVECESWRQRCAAAEADLVQLRASTAVDGSSNIEAVAAAAEAEAWRQRCAGAEAAVAELQAQLASLQNAAVESASLQVRTATHYFVCKAGLLRALGAAQLPCLTACPTLLLRAGGAVGALSRTGVEQRRGTRRTEPNKCRLVTLVGPMPPVCMHPLAPPIHFPVAGPAGRTVAHSDGDRGPADRARLRMCAWAHCPRHACIRVLSHSCPFPCRTCKPSTCTRWR